MSTYNGSGCVSVTRHGAQLGSGKLGQVVIHDDDANDTFRAWAEPRYNYVLESDGAVAVTVRLAGQYEHEISQMALNTVTVRQRHRHRRTGLREFSTERFTFAPYETEKTIHINILDDRKKEAPELYLHQI